MFFFLVITHEHLKRLINALFLPRLSQSMYVKKGKKGIKREYDQEMPQSQTIDQTTPCADPESFIRGGPTLSFFILVDDRNAT